jgi:DNA uptake protein ComE-like DNA-binding protein
MSLYTPRQLLLILLLVGAAGAGLAIDHARRARPDLVERLERLDRVERPEPAAPHSPAIAPAATQTRTAPHPASRAPRESAGARRTRSPAPAEPIDINRASEPELVRLPGVGPALAARIVAARPFADIDDLRRLPGLRRGIFERLRPLVAVLP